MHSADIYKFSHVIHCISQNVSAQLSDRFIITVMLQYKHMLRDLILLTHHNKNIITDIRCIKY